MNSKIEQLIEELEAYIANCPYSRFSSTKILVNKEEIEDMLLDLKKKAPEEIGNYRKVVSNKDAIMRDARQKAEAMLAGAQAQLSQLVNQEAVVQQANEQARLILEDAQQQAQMLIQQAQQQAQMYQASAAQYTDQLLANTQMILERSITENQKLTEDFASLMMVVNSNRAELNPNAVSADDIPEVQPPTDEEIAANAKESAAAAAAKAQAPQSAIDGQMQKR